MSRGLHYYFSSNLYTPAPKMSYPNDKRRFRVICNLKTLACLAVSSRNFMKALKKTLPFSSSLSSHNAEVIWGTPATKTQHDATFLTPPIYLFFPSCHLLQWVRRKAEINFFFQAIVICSTDCLQLSKEWYSSVQWISLKQCKSDSSF